MADWRSKLAGCRSALSILEIKVKISETNYCSFYKTLALQLYLDNTSGIIHSSSCFRFVDMYGDLPPKLADEDKKKFEMWMESWIEEKQAEFLRKFKSNFHFNAYSPTDNVACV